MLTVTGSLIAFLCWIIEPHCPGSSVTTSSRDAGGLVTPGRPEIQRGFPLELWRGSLSASWERIGKMLSAEHTYSIFSSSWLQAREYKWQYIINCCSSGFLWVLRISGGEGGEVSWVLSTSMSFPSEVPAVPWEAEAVPVWLRVGGGQWLLYSLFSLKYCVSFFSCVDFLDQ